MDAPSTIPVRDGLLLQRLCAADAPELEALRDGYTAHRNEWLYPGTAETFIRDAMQHEAVGTGFWAGIRQRGQLVGVVGLSLLHEEAGAAAVDFMLATPFRGRGTMTTAVRALVDHGFARLGLSRIEIQCDAANAPPRRVAERLGFRLDACHPGHIRYGAESGDLCVYALGIRDWREAHARRHTPP